MTPFLSPGLDALATAVVFIDRNRVVEYANAAAENLLKVSVRTIVGHRIQEVFVEALQLLAAIEQAAQRQSSYTQHDLALASSSGERLEVSCTVTPAEIGVFDGFLLEFVETRWVGLFSLVVAAMQAGTVFYMKSGEPEHVAKHAVVDAEGRNGFGA